MHTLHRILHLLLVARTEEKLIEVKSESEPKDEEQMFFSAICGTMKTFNNCLRNFTSFQTEQCCG